MSIVALKRRAKLLNNQSGRDPSAKMLIRDGCECPPGSNTNTFSTGGGFSLNGKYRNIGRVGKNSLQSIGGSRMKPGTTNYKGSGGCCGGYKNNPSPNNQCCLDDSNTVKPSTLNTRGMLANRFRWTKRNIPAEDFKENGALSAPDNNQIQDIYNNWVSGENGNYNIKKSSQQYTENLAATLAYKNRNLNKDSGIVNCALDQNGKCSKGHHIGGKYVPAKPYAKLLNVTGTASRAIEGAIANRASLFPKGYNKPFPYDPQPNQCVPRAGQGDDENVLKSYYADENNTSVFDCPGPVIVGQSGRSVSESKAVIWQSPPTALKDESGNTNYDFATAFSINSNGEIVGDINKRPYYWSSSTANGKPLRLTDGDDIYELGVARSINSNGEIVGYVFNVADDYDYKPAYWSSSDANVKILPVAPDLLPLKVFGIAFDINSNGEIVGTIFGPATFFGSTVPVYWDDSVSHTLTRLTPAGAGQALSINSNGEIVGVRTGNRFPVYWENYLSSEIRLNPDLTTGNGAANSINEKGEIVGVHDRKPAYWNYGNSSTIKYLSSNEETPFSINSKGEIVGSSTFIIKYFDRTISPVGPKSALYWRDRNSSPKTLEKLNDDDNLIVAWDIQ
jgi:hypothetical protein